MRLFAVTHKADDGEFFTDLYMADNHDHAEDQCKNENPENITIVCNVRIPFYMIERAYYLGKKRG
jgi:hypothetical protein